MDKVKVVKLATKHIRIDGGTQPRAELNEAVVQEYSEAMKAGAEFPPCVVFYDGSNNWLADGFHRYFGASKASMSLLCEQRAGSRRDAILYSVGANNTHGLRRTNADKRRAVETLLHDDEWSARSDNWIAEACNVSNHLVAEIRKSTWNSPSAPVRQASDGRTINTANIGTHKPAPAPQVDSTPEYFTDGESPDDEIITGDDAPATPRDPNGVYIETKTEVVNADLPEETSTTDLDDLTQEEQDALSDDEWLSYLPLTGKLVSENIDARLFRDAATNWRKLRKTFQALRREVKATVNANAPDAYSTQMRTAVSLAHPKDWKFSRAAAGGFLLW